jgi:thiamine transport system substrate-binding protein
MKSVYGDGAPKPGQKLKGRVLTVTPGWSEAYGLFTKGEAPMVLSYTTSPAYHVIAEKDGTLQGGGLCRGPLHAGRGRRA